MGAKRTGYAALAAALGMVGVVVGSAGCAAIREQEGLQMDRQLAAAGFQVRPANTPAKLAQLKTLTPLKVMPKQQDGKPFFVVADPYECKCLYVGDQKAYDAYQKLSLQQEYAEDNLEAAEMNEDAAMDWGMWGPWGGWY
jgi:hypothetical protein